MDYDGTKPIRIMIFKSLPEFRFSHVNTVKDKMKSWINRTVADRITDFVMYLLKNIF